jgi:hypothetical protein
MKNTVIEFFQNLPKEKHEQFNEGFRLYRDSPNKNLSIERTLNAGGYSERALENLLYDLQKMHGITDVEKVSINIDDVSLQKSDGDERILILEQVSEIELENILSWAIDRQELFGDVAALLDFAILQENEIAVDHLTKAVEDLNEIEDFRNKSILTFEEILTLFEEDLFAWGLKRKVDSDDLEILLEFAISEKYEHAIGVLNKVIYHLATPILPNSDSDAYVKALTEQNENLALDNKYLEEENQNLVDEKEELEEEKEALKDEVQTLKLAPKIDNQSIRVEFPFLNNAECPDEFKILIADKITAWNRYLELQEQITVAKYEKADVSLDELARLGSEAVKCFDDNQKIYDELNCYQTTGKVLGVHPLFKKLQLTREVENMTQEELYNYKGSSSKYFSDNKKGLAKAVKSKNEKKILEIKTRVSEREIKLALVNKVLGINPK